MSSSVTNNKIIKGLTVNNPGDLVHMDQAESSTPIIPLTYSGNNDKQKIFILSMFVDSISKRLFCEFWHSTSTEETITSNRRVEYDYKQL